MPTPKPLPIGSPAPKAYSVLDGERLAIDVLCPEVAMTHFSFGNFRREEADEVKVVHCPICGRKHALMWPSAWLQGTPSTRRPDPPGGAATSAPVTLRPSRLSVR